MDNLSLFVKLGLDMQKFEKGLTQASQKMQAFGKSMTKTGKDLSMKVTAPIVGLGAVILNTAGNFEAAMNKVQAVSGATGSEFEALEKQARELGATTQFSATQAAEAMTFLSMAGFEANEILGAMPSTLNLAAAAQLDMGSAADIVSNIMAGFNMTSEELSGAVDVLAKQFTTSNTNLSQLGEAMKYVAPVASGLGVSIEETSAAIGILSDAGIQGSMAGTGLRRILSALSQESDKLGISVYNSDGTLRGFADIMQDLEATGISTTKIMEVFGDRGGPAMVALLSRGSDAIREQTAALEDSGGTADKLAKTQMKGLNGALNALRSAFQELMLAIADSGLLDAVTSFAQRVTELVRGLSETNPAILRMITVAAGLAAAIGPVLILIGQMSIGLGAVAAGVKALTIAIAANPIGAFAIAIGVAVAALQAYKYATREASVAATALDDIQRDVNKKMVQEEHQLSSLMTQIRKTNKGSDERRKLIEKLNENYGDYIGFTVDENTEIGKLETAYKNVVKAMRDKATEQIALAKKQEILENQFEAGKKILDEYQKAMQAGGARQEDRFLKRYEGQIGSVVGNIHELISAHVIYNQVGKDAADTFREQVGISDELFDAYLALEGRTIRVDGSTVHLSQRFRELDRTIQDGRDATKQIDDLLGGLSETINENQESVDSNKQSLSELTSLMLEAKDKVNNTGLAFEILGKKIRDALGSEELKDNLRESINLTGAYADKTQEYGEVVMRAAQSYAQFLTPAIDGAFNALAQGENVFKGLMDGLKQMIVQLIKAVAQAAILAAIMNILAPGSSAAAGGVLGIFKNLVGIQGFANGGVPPVGRPSIVGERGPELFVPHSKGTVVPNGMLGGGEVTFRIQGRELVGILGRESKMTNRL